jgi:PAS domain S-box-containing protein
MARQNEARNFDESSWLAAIVNSSSDAIISVTLNCVMQSWNRGAERLYGYSAAAAIGQPISILIPKHRAGEEARILEKVQRGELVDHYETERVVKDGRMVSISLTVSPIKDLRGNLVGMSVVGRDITDRKRGEAERSRLSQLLGERNKELATMYGVAHLVQLEEKPTIALLEEITALLPPAWQYPEVTGARVRLGEAECKTPNFRASRWSQRAEFTTTDGRKGVVEVVYLAERPPAAEGPFLCEERKLINGVAEGLKAFWERKRLESEILEISEREQRRIGQDLHDGLSQQLRGVAYISHVLHDRLVRQGRPESADSGRITKLLNQAVDEARSLARGLFPVDLEASGLMTALKAFAATAKSIYRISCRFACPKPVLIHDNPTAVHLYRIAQEAVQNAIRHGKATRVVITLAAGKAGVTLCIRDNGRGFPETLPETRGMGMEIMKYRARMIGGSLSHRRGKGQGAGLVCLLPTPLGHPRKEVV